MLEIKKYLEILQTYTTRIDTNCHHRGTLLSHSIWTARKVDQYLTRACDGECEEWIITALVSGLNDKSKWLAVIGGLFHDIGKCDGNYATIIKPDHPAYGYRVIEKITNDTINNRPPTDTNSCFYWLHRLCLTISNGSLEEYTKYMAFFAIVSKYHQVLGDIMVSGADKRNSVIRDFVSSLYSDYNDFGLVDFDLDILHVLLLISLSDVKGAWKVTRKDKRASLFPSLLYSRSYGSNNFKQCPNPDNDCKNQCGGTPWERYGYDRVSSLLDTIFFMFGELRLQQNGLYITYLDRRINLYKAVKNPEQYINSTYNNPTWVARQPETASIYIRSGFTHIIKYRIKRGHKARMIRLDDKQNLKAICILFLKHIRTFKDKKSHDLFSRFIYAYIDPVIGEKIEQEGVENLEQNLKALLHFIDRNRIRRKSYHTIDIQLSKDVICKLSKVLGEQIDGYISNSNVRFHEEVMICRPLEKLELVEIFPARKKTNVE